MKHLDLFSGIGGFALATEMVWPEVEHIFCDIEPFSQAILKKHWPNAQIYGDIRTLTAHPKDPKRQLAVEWQSHQKDTILGTESARGVDLLTGGFPCQPFSQAGKRRGTQDDRYLWPEMLRVIREFHPRWVIGENVGGFVTWNDGMVLEQVHADLESEGYEVQAFIIPAVSVNAPHRRDRVWIVAHSTNAGDSRNARKLPRSHELEAHKRPQERHGEFDHADNTSGDDTHRQREVWPWLEGQSEGQHRPSGGTGSGQEPSWNQNWLEVAARLCTVDDGLPNGLARPKGWRNAALKGAGNAIVPQVAAEIFRAIKAVDEQLV